MHINVRSGLLHKCPHVQAHLRSWDKVHGSAVFPVQSPQPNQLCWWYNMNLILSLAARSKCKSIPVSLRFLCYANNSFLSLLTRWPIAQGIVQLEWMSAGSHETWRKRMASIAWLQYVRDSYLIESSWDLERFTDSSSCDSSKFSTIYEGTLPERTLPSLIARFCEVYQLNPNWIVSNHRRWSLGILLLLNFLGFCGRGCGNYWGWSHQATKTFVSSAEFPEKIFV